MSPVSITVALGSKVLSTPKATNCPFLLLLTLVLISQTFSLSAWTNRKSSTFSSRWPSLSSSSSPSSSTTADWWVFAFHSNFWWPFYKLSLSPSSLHRSSLSLVSISCGNCRPTRNCKTWRSSGRFICAHTNWLSSWEFQPNDFKHSFFTQLFALVFNCFNCSHRHYNNQLLCNILPDHVAKYFLNYDSSFSSVSV